MIKEICEKFDFPKGSGDFFEECLEKILSDKNSAELLIKAQDELFAGNASYEDTIDELANKSGIHRYSVSMTMLLFCLRPLYYIYRKKGYPDNMFAWFIKELRCKLFECIEVYGIFGTFTRGWYRRFFICELFSFCRLELGMTEMRFGGYRDIVREHDRAFDCHIPSGEKLLIDDVYASFSNAYEFFKQNGLLPDDNILTVTCHSWLLYPDTLKLFPENGNVRRFAALFDVIDIAEEDPSVNFWRVFGKQFDGNLENIPCDTSLRRRFAEHLRAGGKMGIGYGVLRFDGEKILQKYS